MPSQCSVSVWKSSLSLSAPPVAHTSSAAIAATAANLLKVAPGLGLGTICHDTPSQCSARVCSESSTLPVAPTAHISVAESAETEYSWLYLACTPGLATTPHCTPSQCSTSVCVAPA